MLRRLAIPLLLLITAGCAAIKREKAISRNDIRALQAMVDAGKDIKPHKSLCLAAINGRAKSVEFMLDHGAEIEDMCHWSTPLSRAAAHEQWNVVKVLIKRGADVDTAIDYVKHSSNLWRTAETRDRLAARLRKLAGRTSRQAPTSTARSREPGLKTAPRHAFSSVDKPSYRMQERKDDFAIVIGIDDYKDLPNAQFAERDANAVAAHMRALGIPRRHIIHLTGSDATFTSIRKYLDSWLPRNVKPSSRVFFYFSGHGAPDIQSGKAYLVPWDGDASFLESTAYPVEKLYASLNQLKAKEVIVALDACFSGAGGRSVLAEGARPLVTKVDMGKSARGNLTLLTAASGNEITTTLKEERHGIFTYFLLKGLNGAATDRKGRITVKSLYKYLKPLVQDEARLQNREQTPIIQYKTNVVLRSR